METVRGRVSVLVAVYNASSTLRKSMDSLLGQTYSDLQVVCVDDASSDETPAILHEYACRDSRVMVVRHAVNRGACKARNTALLYADGEYCMFLDADDTLSQDAVEKAVQVFTEYPDTDTVLFQLLLTDGKSEEFPFPMAHFNHLTGREAFLLSLDWSVHGVYIHRMQLSHRFPYDDSCHTYSDDNTTRIHYLYSRAVRECQGIYYYYQNPQSATHRVTLYRFDYLKASERMKATLVSLKVQEEILDRYEIQRLRIVVDAYYFYHSWRHRWNARQRAYALGRIRKSWRKLETHRLPGSEKFKFGYCPLKKCWPLFMVEEEIYFMLRKMKQRLTSVWSNEKCKSRTDV